MARITLKTLQTIYGADTDPEVLADRAQCDGFQLWVEGQHTESCKRFADAVEMGDEVFATDPYDADGNLIEG